MKNRISIFLASTAAAVMGASLFVYSRNVQKEFFAEYAQEFRIMEVGRPFCDEKLPENPDYEALTRHYCQADPVSSDAARLSAQIVRFLDRYPETPLIHALLRKTDSLTAAERTALGDMLASRRQATEFEIESVRVNRISYSCDDPAPSAVIGKIEDPRLRRKAWDYLKECSFKNLIGLEPLGRAAESDLSMRAGEHSGVVYRHLVSYIALRLNRRFMIPAVMAKAVAIKVGDEGAAARYERYELLNHYDELSQFAYIAKDFEGAKRSIDEYLKIAPGPDHPLLFDSQRAIVLARLGKTLVHLRRLPEAKAILRSLAASHKFRLMTMYCGLPSRDETQLSKGYRPG